MIIGAVRSRWALVLVVAVVASLLAAAAATGFRRAGSQQTSVPSRRVPEAIGRVLTPCPWVSVTFDDGPDPDHTPVALDALASFGAGATFYVVGAAVDEHPALARRAARMGHELANHTYSHDDLVGRTDRDVLDELDRTDDALRRASVEPVAQVRPPRGRLDPTAAEAIRGSGRELVAWSASPDPLLKSRMDPIEAAERIAAAASPGTILLLHDGGPIAHRSMSALEPLLAALADRGLRSVPVGELMASAVTGSCEGAGAGA